MPLHLEVGIELLCDKRKSEKTPSLQGVGFGGSEDSAVGTDGTVSKETCKFLNIVKKC